ncbi:hypothetical protein PYH66_07325 [Staphylococcus delphini]|uniref:hypothetical protein n=1 Tax=Staphylococcus delphini TaxID=53344 RepID=UPI0033650AEB
MMTGMLDVAITECVMTYIFEITATLNNTSAKSAQDFANNNILNDFFMLFHLPFLKLNI